MEKLKFVYWEDRDLGLDDFIEFPNDLMQSKNREDLQKNLKEVYKEFNGGKTPCIREMGEINFP